MSFKVVGIVAVLLIAIGSTVWISGNQNEVNHLAANQSAPERSTVFNQPSLAANHLPVAHSQKNKDTDAQPNKKTLSAMDNIDNSDIAEPDLQSRLDAIHKRRPELDISLQQLQALINKPNAWHTDPLIANELSAKLRPGEAKDGRVFIRFNPLKIETLTVNDSLEIPIPHRDKTFTMHVAEVDDSDPDITVWRGELVDFGEINRVNIIQGHENGETVTHIGINTPDGFYVTDVFDDKGWIVPGGTLTNKGGEVVIAVDENGVAGEPEYHGLESSAEHY